jgi:hypothetical protein
MTSERDWLAHAIARDEALRLREDRLRRAITHIWQAVSLSAIFGSDDLDRARALLIELEDEPWPSQTSS